MLVGHQATKEHDRQDDAYQYQANAAYELANAANSDYYLIICLYKLYTLYNNGNTLNRKSGVLALNGS